MPPKVRYISELSDDGSALDGGYFGRIYLNKFAVPNFESPDYVKPAAMAREERVLISQGNPYKELGKSQGRIGGDFKMFRNRLIRNVNTPRMWVDDSTYKYTYVGRFRATRDAQNHPDPLEWDSNHWPEALFSSKDELEAYGTTAIALVEPTNPLAGLTQTLGELKREGLPSIPGIQLWKDRTQLAKSAGGEYLNKEFGWDPLIGDVRKLVHSMRNAEKLIAQYDRGSGRKIKRRFEWPEEKTVIVDEGNSFKHLWPRVEHIHSGLFAYPPRYKNIRTIIKKRWFEGCFTYYLPPHKVGGNNWERNRRLAHKLYGASITPEAVWDLAPWSWAVDWVSNAGDVIHNIGAFADNGLVMQYGYVMEEIIHREERTVSDILTRRSATPGEGDGSTVSCFTALETITKQRVTATPYGFGLDFDGFNPFQLSILTALGLSRRG